PGGSFGSIPSGPASRDLTSRRCGGGFEKLDTGTGPKADRDTFPTKPPPGNPRIGPGFLPCWARGSNNRPPFGALRRAPATLPAPPIAVTTLPLTADLIGAIPVRRWVYYCVDDFSTWPGLDGVTLQRMEENLVRRVDRVIAVSETLRQRLVAMGCASELLTHGGDLAFWRTNAEPPPEYASLPKPLVVFWGVIDRRL